MTQLKDIYKAFIKSEDKLGFIFYDGWVLYGESLRESRVVGFIITIFSLVELFIEEKITRKAADLTYSTIMSIVPILAIIFAVAKGFGMEDMMWTQIEKLIGAGDIMDQVLMSVSKSVEMTKANSGWIFGVAVLALLYTANNAMCKLEDIFNEIWNVKTSRGWFGRLPLNVFFLIVLPGAILMVGAVTGEVESVINPYFKFSNWVMRCLIVSVAFIIIYKTLPETTVRWRGAIYSGIIAGVSLTVWHFCYLEFQNILFNYNKVYGSFAAIPFFLIWTLISWIICLLGAKLNMVLQMRMLVKGWSIHDQKILEDLSLRAKMQVVLTVASVLVRNFMEGKSTTKQSIVKHTRLSYIYVSYAMDVLLHSGLVHGVQQKSEEEEYYPTVSVENMTVGDFVRTIFRSGHDTIAHSSADVKEYVDTMITSATANDTTLLRDLNNSTSK
ncbi:MAG: YihY/virulence factor BrkB family protein [Bacteroidaceae bacterium]|nr:YihY/virulence factor BrkB family protein [Bacteroidaceae bacterium]